MLGGTLLYLPLSSYPETPSAICTPVGCGRICASASGDKTLVSVRDGTGRKGGHLEGDLTQEAKMAGLAHEMWTELWIHTLLKICRKRLIIHPEITMGASST